MKIDHQTTHAPGCWGWGPSHYECAVGQVERDEELLQKALEALESADWYIGQLEWIVYSPDDTGTHEERTKVQSTIAALRERLGVKLGISITPYPIYQPEKHSVIAKQRRVSDTMREANPSEVLEMYGKDPYAATRRAIVRAAAAIGEEK